MTEQTAKKLRDDEESSPKTADARELPAPEATGPALAIFLFCTYCHGRIERAAGVYCAACLAPSHEDCFLAHKRCSAPGCGETRIVRPQAAAPARVGASALSRALLVALALAALGAVFLLPFQEGTRRRARPAPAAPAAVARPAVEEKPKTEEAPRPEKLRLFGHSELPIQTLALSPAADAKHVILGTLRGLSTIDLETGEEKTILNAAGPITKAAFSRDGKHALLADGGSRIFVADLTFQKPTRSIELGRADTPVMAMAISRDGTSALLASENVFCRWDLTTGRKNGSLERSSQEIDLSPLTTRAEGLRERLALTPEGTPSWKNLRRELNLAEADLDYYRDRRKREWWDTTAVAFSPGGSFAVTSGRELTFWDLERGIPVRKLASGAPSQWLAFCPDGRHVLAGAGHGPLEYWDIDSGTAKSLLGHGKAVTAVAVSSLGDRAVTGSMDGSIKLWNLDAGLWLDSVPVRGDEDHATSVAFTSDQKSVVVATAKGQLLCYRIGAGRE